MSSSRVRPLRAEDVDAVAALFVKAWGESRRMDGNEIREWCDNQALNPEHLTRPSCSSMSMSVLRQSNTWECEFGDRASAEPQAQ